MKTIEARNWNAKDEAYLWVETGTGQLLRVSSINAEMWIRAGTMSWCCHGGTTLYLGTAAEAAEQERLLRADLAARRERWNRRAEQNAAGREPDYGGVLGADNQVHSDADPGL